MQSPLELPILSLHIYLIDNCEIVLNCLFCLIRREKEKNKQMSQKDLTEKLLEDYNDVFADIVNGLLFNGEQRVKAEDLS